ncbi:response regulator [Pseudoduganella sp. GCM10020061]|uniref:response regulator n=1 Tax=Pseudoduganella sp. GCM10020061 TaxID=3317345 RepID=UPI00363D05DB
MSLPVYQHPGLTVLVDDSDSFLRSLSFQLDPTLASEAFHDTRAALAWLRGHSPARERIGAVASGPDGASRWQEGSGAPDIERLHATCYDGDRFATPTVLVVDYSMPQMNGLDFCKEIASLPCKKILFTGAADEKIAVEAFNRGLIDRFIKKSDDDALERLEQDIQELQRDYFVQQSAPLRELLALNGYGFISDRVFADLVRDISGPLGIVEHYLFPNPAGLLMFDAAGKASLLVVETDASMQAHVEVARDNKAPASLLAAVHARHLLPFFHDGDGMYSASVGENWQRYCRPAQTCAGAERYYWAIFELPATYLKQKVRPYSGFLRDHTGSRRAA